MTTKKVVGWWATFVLDNADNVPVKWQRGTNPMSLARYTPRSFDGPVCFVRQSVKTGATTGALTPDYQGDFETAKDLSARPLVYAARNIHQRGIRSLQCVGAPNGLRQFFRDRGSNACDLDRRPFGIHALLHHSPRRLRPLPSRARGRGDEWLPWHAGPCAGFELDTFRASPDFNGIRQLEGFLQWTGQGFSGWEVSAWATFVYESADNGVPGARKGTHPHPVPRPASPAFGWRGESS